MDLKSLQRNWNAFANRDPMWAILAYPDRQGNRWKVDEFFATGKSEIASVLATLEELGLEVPRQKALDFGCGIGRLSQALAGQFREVTGVDIAPSMIRQAQQFNQFGERCRFVLNDKADLKIFPDESFDFIYTNIVLQHLDPAYCKAYLREFIRILRTSGVLVFQLPSQRRSEAQPVPTPHTNLSTQPAPRIRWRSLVKAVVPEFLLDIYRACRAKFRQGPQWKMHATPRDEMLNYVTKIHGTVVDTRPTDDAAPNWDSVRYVVRKAAPL
jgi:ubiquinone/menaquinone biosynthesis C-methylase UbiE